VLGFAVFERTRNARGLEEFRQVSQRYHVRDAANAHTARSSAPPHPPGVEYLLREVFGLDDIPSSPVSLS
jgi:hypothetical protein